MERMGQKSAENLIQGVKDSLKQPYHKVLFALGIRHVGETVAQKLAQAFIDIDTLKAATQDELLAVDDIGVKIADSLMAYFSDSTIGIASSDSGATAVN